MKRPQSSGKCNLCGDTFTKASMKGHLRKCKQPKSPAPNIRDESLHIVVQGGHRNIYWLHLAVPQHLPLSALDDFLRRTWLECCGHMSAFTIAGQRYAAVPMEDLGGIKERSMKVSIGHVLSEGARFMHEYDYGSTTELSLEVAGLIHLDEVPKGIKLLARNAPPEISCVDCEAIATQVCTQCLWQGGGWVCDQCATEHECGEEMLLPVVNSPRVGVCGYTG
jgi:Plasmid pRiA4b ORF-3-like protein